MLNTPILFIIFNRPETTKKVFDSIREARPKQLFIAADGPRTEEEKERCIQARKIATQIDWECEVQTLFRDENRGCGRGPAEAINWFFEHVEQGIILEDDCLPDLSFFIFCQTLLNYYKDDKRIMNICGTNQLGEWKNKFQSYHFSNYSGIWGWATWKRAWQYFDYQINLWKNPIIKELLKDNLISTEDYLYRSSIFDKTANQTDVSWWDYQWHFARLSQSGLGIVPSVNLISNIGFGKDATHTFDPNSQYANIKRHKLSTPIKINNFIICDKDFDQKIIVGTNIPTKNRLVSKVINRLKW